MAKWSRNSNFRRYPREGWIAGVCEGLAVHFDWNVKLIRVLAIIGFFMSGFFPLAVVYGALWYVMDEDNGPSPAQSRESTAGASRYEARDESWRASGRAPASREDLRERFEHMERRLRGMEACVASNELELRRELRKLEG